MSIHFGTNCRCLDILWAEHGTVNGTDTYQGCSVTVPGGHFHPMVSLHGAANVTAQWLDAQIRRHRRRQDELYRDTSLKNVTEMQRFEPSVVHQWVINMRAFLSTVKTIGDLMHMIMIVHRIVRRARGLRISWTRLRSFQSHRPCLFWKSPPGSIGTQHILSVP